MASWLSCIEQLRTWTRPRPFDNWIELNCEVTRDRNCARLCSSDSVRSVCLSSAAVLTLTYCACVTSWKSHGRWSKTLLTSRGLVWCDAMAVHVRLTAIIWCLLRESEVRWGELRRRRTPSWIFNDLAAQRSAAHVRWASSFSCRKVGRLISQPLIQPSAKSC